jgi:hypothetical protein
MKRVGLCAAVALTVGLALAATANAADIGPDSPRLATGVAKAPG